MPKESNRESEQRFTPEEEERRPSRVEMNTRFGMESFSIGNTISKMMDEEYLPEINFATRRVPEAKDRDVLNFMMRDIVNDLRHNAEMRKIRLKVKEKGYESLSPQDKKMIFKVYDRIKGGSLKDTQKKFGPRISSRQIRKIKFNTTSELNYSLRERIIEGGEPEGWMILEPKLRKVDLMDAKTMKRYLRNSLNPKGDIKFIREEVENDTASADMKKVGEEFNETEGKIAA